MRLPQYCKDRSEPSAFAQAGGRNRIRSRGLCARCLVGRKVELQRHTARILEEYLVDVQRGHRALAKRDRGFFRARIKPGEIRAVERDVVDGAAAFERGRTLVA